MTPSSRRAAARIGSIALAAAFAAAVAAPAQAQADFTFNAYVVTTFGNQFEAGFPEAERQAGTLVVSVDAGGQAIEVESTRAVLTIDESFAGLSLDTEDERCTASGNTLTCEEPDRFTGFAAEFGFFLVVEPEVRPGDVAAYEIAVDADGATDTIEHTWEFAEAGSTAPDYVVNAHDAASPAPGAAANPAVEFQYNGEQGYEDFYFRVHGRAYYPQQGYVTPVLDYANCGLDEGGSEYCILEGFAPEPGRVYELSADTPIDLVPTADAPGPMRFPEAVVMEAITDEDLIDSIDFYDADTELAFVPGDAERIPNHPYFDVITADNPFDLDMADANVNGSAGDDAFYDIAYTNDSAVDAIISIPPWDVDVFDPYLVAIQLPTGVEVTAGDPETGYFTTPDRYGCQNLHIYERPAYAGIVAPYGIDDLDLVCEIGDVVQSGATETFRLPVEITSGTPTADGRSAVLDPALFWGEHALEEYEMTPADFPFLDADLDNNTSVLSLNTETPGLPATGTSPGLLGGLGALLVGAGAAAAVLARRLKAAQ
ncbi:hypothetical protein [Glycomyces sp. NPDC047010]|uniref:hypothetical protein n=1 Tax=Glycomyces sp. NPDC047010 TaxID=3155023 RepID=UPI0033EA4C4D